MDYKNTLNLPRTDFPMKADLPGREPLILERWKELYKRIREVRKEKKTFLLHDGPPYANGRIHMGHALNKVLKDVINKYYLMRGMNIHYIPGWDCHGLPIERQVEKELKARKIRKESLPKSEFRKLCRNYAERFVGIQREEFIRLGILADWEKPYLTMDPSYEAQEIRELGRFFRKGLVYRSKKPVYWCIYDTTAEAEAEVEYQEREDPSIYVSFPLKGEEKTFLVIWTTTPWTLPANLAVMVGEEFSYVYLRTEQGVLVVAEELVPRFVEETGLRGDVVRKLKGADLVGREYIHPFVKRSDLEEVLSGETLRGMWRIYPSEFVELGAGTGLVHMAPGHGQEDYLVGSRYGLEPYSPVDDRGRFVPPAPEFLRGLRVFDANHLIVNLLKEKGFLIHRSVVKHSYPHCWRCKNPVIFRATYQWFIGMSGNLDGETLRERALKEIEGVEWIPPYGKNRIRSMVENRPDWCISRQRYWGVPITVFYCNNCGSVTGDQDIFEHVASLVENNPSGADIWFERDARELLPEGYRCKRCGGDSFKKEEDILDVWFDSGCSHAAVLRPLGYDRADMYLEGSDQHRGWFQASLLEAVGSYGHAPYRSVLTHGFTVDEKGRKMSKSLGNVVSPQDIVERYGADILRLWVVSEDYTEDVKLGESIIRNLIEDYRKIRNTVRFLLSNLYDFDPASHSVPVSKLHHFDRWMLSTLQGVISEVHRHYRSYAFHRVYHLIRNFCATTLSSLYLDVLKDRLYVYAPDSWERRSAQTVLYRLLSSLTAVIAPFLSFTAEEIWTHLRKINPDLPESVFLSEMPQPEENLVSPELEEDYKKLIAVRDEVMGALERARRKGLIRHPYEARIFLRADPATERLLRKYEDYLNFFFTVSQISFGEGGDVVEEGEALVVGVGRAEGRKCPRCWIYYPEREFTGEVCRRCAEVLGKLGYACT